MSLLLTKLFRQFKRINFNTFSANSRLKYVQISAFKVQTFINFYSLWVFSDFTLLRPLPLKPNAYEVKVEIFARSQISSLVHYTHRKWIWMHLFPHCAQFSWKDYKKEEQCSIISGTFFAYWDATYSRCFTLCRVSFSYESWPWGRGGGRIHKRVKGQTV